MLKKWFCAFVFIFLISGAAFAYDNSPARTILIPEVIWAPASGGGTWSTAVMVTSLSYGTILNVDFYYGGSGHRYIASFWGVTVDYLRSRTFWNILENMQTADPSFTYYGKVGSLIIQTQDTNHLIQAQARTTNGNYGKTFQGLAVTESNVAITGRDMMIQNMSSTAKFRTFAGFYNFSLGTMVVNFVLYDHSGNMLGSIFTKTFTAGDFQSFNPFVEAGYPYPTYEVDNAVLVIRPTSGGAANMGLMGFGSSANNYTNDTYAHWMVPCPASNN